MNTWDWVRFADAVGSVLWRCELNSDYVLETLPPLKLHERDLQNEWLADIPHEMNVDTGFEKSTPWITFFYKAWKSSRIEDLSNFGHFRSAWKYAIILSHSVWSKTLELSHFSEFLRNIWTIDGRLGRLVIPCFHWSVQ